MTSDGGPLKGWGKLTVEDTIRPQPVAEQGGALELERDIFQKSDPSMIAAALKQFAEASPRRRSGPFRSAMSMLTFHINRAGDSLDPQQRAVLEAAKDELRAAFGRPRRE
jgi:hypothetical protein